VRELAESLRTQLASVPGLTLHDPGVERCGIVTFTIDGVDVYELAARLRTEAINISVSTIDFARYDFEARGLAAVARASVHYYNTDHELARLVDALRR
jgi:selenocysteine lyase/cysteine desulfurase